MDDEGTPARMEADESWLDTSGWEPHGYVLWVPLAMVALSPVLLIAVAAGWL